MAGPTEKFKPQVAEAYLRRGRALERLDMPDEALEVYRELVGRDELSQQEPVAVARERIRALAGNVREKVSS